MPDELDRELLIDLGKDLQELNKIVSAIDAKIEERDKNAKEFRDSVCKKIDAVWGNIEAMRKNYLDQQKDKNKMWVAIFCTFLVPIILYITVSARVEKQVSMNTERLTLIENQYRVWIK